MHALPFLSALLLWLSFPPADLGFFSWIALMPLMVYAARAPRGGRAFLFGWAAGFAFNAVAFEWLRYSSTWFGPIGVGLYKGLYWGLFVALLRRSSRRWPVVVVAPMIWVALEFTRSYFLGGLPFFVLGYAQHSLTTFIQIADLGGIWLVSLVVALINASLAGVWLSTESPKEVLWTGGTALAIIGLCMLYGTVRLAGIQLEDGLRIGLVQPNIAQDVKELAKGGKNPRQRLEIYERHMQMTREVAKDRPDLIIWPEAAILDELIWQQGRWLEDDFLDRARAPALETGIPVVLGILVIEAPPGEPFRVRDFDRCTFTNSAIYFDAEGHVAGRFDKIRLVHFSERQFPLVAPLVARFLGLAKIYEFRVGTELPVFEHPKGRFSVCICSENYYPEISREFARKGARTIVNISNDGWFRESAELDAQLAMAKFRAIENRVHYVRATNTGISAMIEPTGRIAAMVVGPHGKQKSVSGTLTRVARTARNDAPYRTLGDWAAWLAVGMTFAAVAMPGACRFPKKS